jgi:hypothetical protein
MERKSHPSIANAGEDQTVAAGATVQPDGSGSTDHNGNSLKNQRTLVAIPLDRITQLSDPEATPQVSTSYTTSFYEVLFGLSTKAVLPANPRQRETGLHRIHERFRRLLHGASR